MLKRSDADWWQAIAGGGENNERPPEAAQREAYEETGIPTDADLLSLDTIISIPVTEFKDSHLWGENIYVIPQFCFGVLAQGISIVLSDEHSDYKWLKYEVAYNLMKYDGDRTALWELNQRLRGKGPREEP